MSRALSIAMLSHLASPVAATGAERSLALLASGLRRRGHRVILGTPGPWVLSETLERDGVDVRIIPCRVCWMIEHEPLSSPRAAFKWLRFAWPDGGPARIERFLERFRPDVVHVNCLPHLHGARTARALGFPVLWHVREIPPPGRRRAWFAARLARDARAVVAVSRAVGDWVAAEGLAGSLRVIPNGVEPPPLMPARAAARTKLGLPEEGCLVGLFGQVVPHKGPLEFLAAAATALQRAPELRFVVAGPGPARFLTRIRHAAEASPRPDRFHVLGPQPGSESLMAAADVVCLPTLTPDPLPRTVLEAMAAGRPTVAYRTGGVPEMVEHERTGLLVDPGDVVGLAEALARLGRDTSLRDRLGAAAAERARGSFSMSLHLDRMERLMFEVAE